LVIPSKLTDGASLSVIVPCFNEDSTIETLLEQVRAELPDSQIIVVDDGSSDRSKEIVQRIADTLRLKTVSHSSNCGKGAAVRSGLEAVEREWVLIQDADLEYSPSDAKKMLEATAPSSETAEAVYGSRYLVSGKSDRGMLLAYLAVRLIALFQWLLYGRWMSDPLTCYKMLRTDVMKKMSLRSTGFEICTEINAKLLGSGCRIVEVPIRYQPRTYGQGKKIGAFDFVRLAWSLLRHRFGQHILARPDQQPSRISVGCYVASRLAIGTALLIAGVGKLFLPQPILIGSLGTIPAEFVGGWAFMEIVMGWAALTLIPHRLLRVLVTVVFSIFLVILSLNWAAGMTKCQCLGGGGMPVVAMILLDAIAVISLAVFRKQWEAPRRPLPSKSSDLLDNLTFAIPLVLFAAVFWFGSVNAAWAYLAGHSLLVDSQEKFIGVVGENEKGTATFDIVNVTTVPIRIIGAKASCRCVAVQDLPVTLGPKEEKSIRVSVYGGSKAGPQRESAYLFCDDSASELTLSVTVLVQPNR